MLTNNPPRRAGSLSAGPHRSTVLTASTVPEVTATNGVPTAVKMSVAG